MRALLFDLDNTLLMEDEATFSAVRRACELARDRAGADKDALYAAVLRVADELWRAAPTYAYAEEMGMWWGEGLWGEFGGDAPGLRALHAFVPGFRRDVWRGALAAVSAPDDRLALELDAAYATARRAHQPVDLEAARRAMQGDPQVSLVVLPVEVLQERDEGRREDEHVLGVAEGVAHEQPRAVRNRRGHDVQVLPEGREQTSHLAMVHRWAGGLDTPRPGKTGLPL